MCLARLHAYALMYLTFLFLSCIVVSIVMYTLRLKNPRKATGPDFIHLRFIKFASNVIDSHFHNIIMKNLETGEYFLGKRSLGPFTSLQQRPYLTSHFWPSCHFIQMVKLCAVKKNYWKINSAEVWPSNRDQRKRITLFRSEWCSYSGYYRVEPSCTD